MKNTASSMKLTALALGTGLALAGCTSNAPTEPPTEQQTTPASSSTPPESPSASPSPSRSTGPEKITSEAPKSAEQAGELAFKTVQAHYGVFVSVFQGEPYDDAAFAAVTGDPLYSQMAGPLKRTKESTQTYEGESVPHLIEAIPGQRTIAGEEYPYAAVRVDVCEDNTGVKVTDAEGKKVSSGSVLRYRVTYAVEWEPETKTWKVTRHEVPRAEGGDPKAC